VEDQHRARIVFGLLFGGALLGLAAATVYLAATGPATRWLVAGVAFVVGFILLLVTLWATRGKAPDVRTEASQQANGTGSVAVACLVGVTGVLVGHASGVAQPGVLAASAGYLAGLLLIAKRRVVREARHR
jgi:prepilin signal peptidase PulO-like enzyme (type II secretory pathway)